MKVLVLVFTAILGVIPVVSIHFLSAQTPLCLHGAGESAEQQLRRRQALGRVRQINSAEVVAQTQTGRYQAVESLAGISVEPQGFVTHVAVDTNGYAFSIKDSLDLCGFGYFSDQTGVIYQGEALR